MPSIGVTEPPHEHPWGRRRKLTRLAAGLVRSGTTSNVPAFDAADHRKAPFADAPVYDVVDPNGGSALRYERRASVERRLWRRFVRAARGLHIDPSWADPVRHHIDDGWRSYWRELFAPGRISRG